MIELLSFISYLLTLYVYILVAAAILSWLIAFNVVNTHSQVVATIADFLWRITCLLYTSPSPRDRQKSRMPSSA